MLVTKVLGLKLKPSEESKQIGRLERQLAAARAKATGSKRGRAQVVKLEAALEQAQGELADALAQSAEVRASCGDSCPTCAASTAWSTPGTRLRGSSLGEWVEAWAVLQARRASSARHQAVQAHLDALPDAVVEAAAADELDAFEQILCAAQPSRGRRAGHATTRLLDAVDRRRRQLGDPMPPRQNTAADLLDAATAVLRAEPPAGVDIDYLNSFVHRHHDHLHGLVQAVLDRRAAGAAR